MRPLGKPLGRWLVKALPRETRYDALVPVPLHWWKQFRRGFNHSALLASELSRQTAIPVLPALLRKKSGQTQAGLTRAQRRKNVRGLYALNRRIPVEGRRLLLIDDVLTSGATVNACARVLRQGGAARVDALTLARTDRRSPGAMNDFAVSIPDRGEFA